MANEYYTLYMVDADDVNIDQIVDFRIASHVNRLQLSGDGAIDALFNAVMTGQPMMEFSSTAIKTILDGCALSGKSISGEGTLTAFFQKLAAASRGAASSNVKLTSGQGFLVPLRLSASLGAPANINLRYYALSSDGVTDPVTYAASQTLAGTPDTDEAYTLGPAKINNTAIDCVTSLDIDFGLMVVLAPIGNGEVYPKFAYIQSRRPSITLGIADASLLSTLTTDGAKIASSTLCYLRKLDEGSTRVANETETHISFTVSQGNVYYENYGGAHDGYSAGSIIIEPSYDGTNAVITIDTTAAIS